VCWLWYCRPWLHALEQQNYVECSHLARTSPFLCHNKYKAGRTHLGYLTNYFSGYLQLLNQELESAASSIVSFTITPEHCKAHRNRRHSLSYQRLLAITSTMMAVVSSIRYLNVRNKRDLLAPLHSAHASTSVYVGMVTSRALLPPMRQADSGTLPVLPILRKVF
jgi:hypothetical protein